MAEPTVPASHADLLEQKVATLATVGPDGRPQQSVVWFLARDAVVHLSLNRGRQKTKNLQARPGVGFLVIDPDNTARYLEVRGDAAVEDDDDYAFADEVGQKYGVDLRSFDQPGVGRVKVTVRPTRIHAVDISAG